MLVNWRSLIRSVCAADGGAIEGDARTRGGTLAVTTLAETTKGGGWEARGGEGAARGEEGTQEGPGIKGGGGEGAAEGVIKWRHE